MGRKPIFEESFVMRTRIESSVYDKIPGKKAPFVRAAINEKMARETTEGKSICEKEKNISSELDKKDQEIERLKKALMNGRDYLMQCGSDCNDADALEAFGFGRNGLNNWEPKE